MKARLLLISSLFVTAVYAQQPQPAAIPPEQQKSEEQRRQEEMQRTQVGREPRETQARRMEASQDELKVSAEEARKEVTDANKASSIIGMKVVNRQNQDLGKIKDIVVDLESGKVAYVVLGSGGFFGAGGRLVAVPVAALTPRDGQVGFIIDAEKSRLEEAQGFSDQDWPAIDAASNATVGLQPDPERMSEGSDRGRALDSSGNPRRGDAKDPNRSENR